MAFETLKAALHLDGKQFSAEVKNATAQTMNFAQKFKAAGSNIAAAMGGMAAIGFAKNLGEFAGDVIHTAENLNMATDSFQTLKVVAQQNGVEMEKFSMAMMKVKSAQGDAISGNKTTIDALNKLGINAKDFVGLGVDEAFARIGKAVSESKNPMEAYSAVTAIFGEKIGPKMIATLKAVGEEGLDPLVKKMKEAGMVADQEMLEKIHTAEVKLEGVFTRLRIFAVEALDKIREGWDNLAMVSGVVAAKWDAMTAKLKKGDVKGAFGSNPFAGTGEAIQKEYNEREQAAAKAKAKKQADEKAMREMEKKSAEQAMADRVAKEESEKAKKRYWDDAIAAARTADALEKQQQEEADETARVNMANLKKRHEEARKNYREELEFEERKREIIESPVGITTSADSLMKIGGETGGRVNPMVQVAEKQLQKLEQIRELEERRFNQDKIDRQVAEYGGLGD